MNPSIRQGDPHFQGHRPVQGQELGEAPHFPFQPRGGLRADPELLQVPGEVGRPDHERPSLLIGLLPRRRRVGVDPFVHRADDAVDRGDELDPLARLEGGERRLALAKRRPVRGKLEPVDPPEDSPGEPVQPHLHGAGGIELRPGVAAVDKEAAGQFLRRQGREQRGRLPDGPGFRRRLFPPPEGQIHPDASENRE
jgi:hypothetical protein